MAVKKRIIWVSDEYWSEINANAKASGLNPSQYIVRALELSPFIVVRQGEGRDAADAGDGRTAEDRHARYDSGSRAVNDGGVSFGAPRPAPKK